MPQGVRWFIEWNESLQTYHFYLQYRHRWTRTTWFDYNDVLTHRTYDQCYRQILGHLRMWGVLPRSVSK